MGVVENAIIEFKSNFNDAVIETVVAFSNATGGKIYIGVNNEGIPIKNWAIGKETFQKWLNEIKIKTEPAVFPEIYFEEFSDKTIPVIEVKEFPIKPVSFKGKFFKRVMNSNHLLSAVEISNLTMQSLNTSWDSYPSRFSFDDLSQQHLKKFIEEVNQSKRFQLPFEPKDAMVKLRLMSSSEVSNAGHLLFAKNPTAHNIRIGRFKTADSIIDDKLISLNLVDSLNEAMRFIISHLKVAFDITGDSTSRNEIYEYPLPAIRELLLNAIVHRDYQSASDVQIKIFDKKISFFNPGKLYGGLTIEDLKTNNYPSQTRNKLIAESFYLKGDIEKYGSGFSRVNKEIATYPSMVFTFKEIGDGFYSELSYKVQKSKVVFRNEGLNEELNEGLNEGLKTLLKAIADNPGIQAKELPVHLDSRPLKTIERQVSVLLKQGLILRKGSKKTGGYYLG